MLKPLKKYRDLSKLYLAVTFALFILILLWIVVFKANIPIVPKRIARTKAMTIPERFALGNYPFKNLFVDAEGKVLSRIKEHFLNVLVFIPFGILLPFFAKKGKTLITSIVFIVFTIGFELFQLFTGIGGFDVTDLMTNTLGGFIGLWLYRVAFSKMPDHVINRISFVVNMIFVPVALFAILNTIKHFDYYI